MLLKYDIIYYFKGHNSLCFDPSFKYMNLYIKGNQLIYSHCIRAVFWKLIFLCNFYFSCLDKYIFKY